MDGFLVLNKPLGLTSHDCVAKVRRSLRQKRVGHAGTLDPAASGVLPMAIGRATRLLQFLPGTKAYRATIRLGLTTTTDDLEGEIVEHCPAAHLTLEQVTAELRHFEGKIQQIPPSFSAIQVKGKRLYELARAGQSVEAPVRSVEIYQIQIVAWRPAEYPELEVDIACGAGTYIRAIARDLGQRLRTGGTLAALLRTESSGFRLDESLTLEELANQVQQHSLRLLSPAHGLCYLPAIALNADLVRRWCQGQRITTQDLPAAIATHEPVRIHDSQGAFLGVGQWQAQEEDMRLKQQVVFLPEA